MITKVVKQKLEEADVEENKLLKESLEKLIESQETCQQLQSDLDWVITFHLAD